MKTIVVTGATNGIGLEACVTFAREGHRVLLVGRDAQRTQSSVEYVQAKAGSAGVVEPHLCDFSRQASVRALAQTVLERCPRVDVLVNNAGAVFERRTLTEDGVEATFAVNHLGSFLLTNLLLERLKASAPARIVNVASVAHYRGALDFDDLSYERGYFILKAYARSKLANVLFTRSLAQRLRGTGVTANTLHPGVVATNIWSGGPRWTQPLLNAWKRLFMISAEEGAKTITFLATGEAVGTQTGLYFEKNRAKRASALALDDALAERLWAESARLVKLTSESA